MALRNPYSEYNRADEDSYRREALLQALGEEPEPPMTPHPRTPPPTQQTRERFDGPGGRTQMIDRTREIEDGRDLTNAFSGEVARPSMTNASPGDPWQDEQPAPGGPPSTTTTQTPTHTYNPQRGFDLMDEYDDPYTRRLEGSPSVAGSAAKYGMAAGNVVPGWGHAIGAAAGAIGALFAKNAETAMTDFAINDARQIISMAHKDAFGRDIDPAYLDQIVRGQGWQDGDRWMGQDSVAYVLDAFAQQAPGERAAAAAANAAATTPAAGAPPAGATAGGTGGGLPFSGFDFARAQDPSKSAKDAFASLAQAAPQLTDTSKAGAEAWFRQHIAPGMEAAGYKVYDVQGDKAWIGSREDPEGNIPVDYLINAGGSSPQIGWQPDSGGGAGGAAGDAPADIQGAYAYLKSIAHPGMSRAEMESAVTRAFGNVAGFEKAYAGDVVINGRKIDLITNFEGPGASWSDNLSFVPLHGGGGAGVPTGGGTSGLSLANLAPGVQLAAPLGQSDINRQIQEALQRIISGAPDRDALLAELGGG